mgnify:CR=1 FL=1
MRHPTIPLHRPLAALLAALLCLGLLSACSTTPTDPTAGWSARRLFEEAKLALGNNEFETAISHLEKLRARYPFGRYALQAQLELAYAYYKSDQFDEAIATCDRFIKEHPRNQHVDYAYYLRGLSNFNRSKSLVDVFIPRDDSKRDTLALHNAFADFDTLVRRFPDSSYAADSRQRMIHLRNNMARHELNTARFYYQRGAVVAAANRAKYLLEHFDGTPSTADALALLARSYAVLGEEGLARDTLRVLQRNFPDHEALKGSDQKG